ncbi:MAG TPA: 16S rRNA (adenine(1518)-N(6)/adenine(1519)-N(6))-dimethyltransferase RsmA [Dehalococcoidales bacterium]|nr:16S rRNA (adenine(1518)-N(6)/adenine(1519)-N(6))-dimethyltransferase RsmA [Dehalococcoidales bacterium]
MTESVPQEKSLLAQAKELLRQNQVQAKKSLGQNFLINPAVLDKITRASDLTERDLVFEVGPGLGVLTRQLIALSGHVIAVEVDRRMVELLNKTLGSPPNLSLVQQDILDIEPAELVRQESFRFSSSIPRPYHYKVVANLPYYITQAVIRRFCEAELKPDLMVIMVQKEVARNIVAAPGDLSILAVSIQFFGRPRIVDIVPAGNFYPAPRVDSAILKIEMYPGPAVPVASEADFFKTVRAGFCAARKQVANALSQGLAIPRAEVLSLMQKAGVEPQKRAETLTLEEWARLTKVFFEEKN